MIKLGDQAFAGGVSAPLRLREIDALCLFTRQMSCASVCVSAPLRLRVTDALFIYT